MRCAPRASNGPDHLGLCALQCSSPRSSPSSPGCPSTRPASARWCGHFFCSVPSNLRSLMMPPLPSHGRQGYGTCGTSPDATFAFCAGPSDLSRSGHVPQTSANDVPNHKGYNHVCLGSTGDLLPRREHPRLCGHRIARARGLPLGCQRCSSGHRGDPHTAREFSNLECYTSATGPCDFGRMMACASGAAYGLQTPSDARIISNHFENIAKNGIQVSTRTHRRAQTRSTHTGTLHRLGHSTSLHCHAGIPPTCRSGSFEPS